MASRGDIRQIDDGSFEVLEAIGEGVEVWRPWATFYVLNRFLPKTEDSIANGLYKDGWIAPGVRLEPYICGARGKSREGLRCLLWVGHEGHHLDGTFSWEEGY